MPDTIDLVQPQNPLQAAAEKAMNPLAQPGRLPPKFSLQDLLDKYDTGGGPPMRPQTAGERQPDPAFVAQMGAPLRSSPPMPQVAMASAANAQPASPSPPVPAGPPGHIQTIYNGPEMTQTIMKQLPGGGTTVEPYNPPSGQYAATLANPGPIDPSQFGAGGFDAAMAQRTKAGMYGTGVPNGVPMPAAQPAGQSQPGYEQILGMLKNSQTGYASGADKMKALMASAEMGQMAAKQQAMLGELALRQQAEQRLMKQQEFETSGNRNWEGIARQAYIDALGRKELPDPQQLDLARRMYEANQPSAQQAPSNKMAALQNGNASPTPSPNEGLVGEGIVARNAKLDDAISQLYAQLGPNTSEWKKLQPLLEQKFGANSITSRVRPGLATRIIGGFAGGSPVSPLNRMTIGEILNAAGGNNRSVMENEFLRSLGY